jgi:hypothetical protein
MKVHRPSPAMVVSIVALVVALSGTGIAATRLLVTSTSQIKDGAVTGKDIRAGTITKRNLRPGLLAATGLSGSSVGDATSGGDVEAIEAHRLAGPRQKMGGQATVATLGLPPGVYAVFAKVNVAPDIHDNGLLEVLFKANKTIDADCTLDVGGTGDFSSENLASMGTAHTTTLSMQLTRTLASAGKAVLACKSDNVDWRAADASIIAMKVDRTTRTDVSG